LAVMASPVEARERSSTRKEAVIHLPAGREATRCIRCDVVVLTGLAAGEQATVAGDCFPTASADGATVHSMEDSRKRKPIAMVSPCFTYLCVKITGRCKMLFSKETILSNNPTINVNRLDSTFPFRFRAGNIIFRATCQVKINRSINNTRTFCGIFCFILYK